MSLYAKVCPRCLKANLSPDSIHTCSPTDYARRLEAEVDRLRDAIAITIEENKNLADGDDCTLRHLVMAMGGGEETP